MFIFKLSFSCSVYLYVMIIDFNPTQGIGHIYFHPFAIQNTALSSVTKEASSWKVGEKSERPLSFLSDLSFKTLLKTS